jgi:hypothetical protein
VPPSDLVLFRNIGLTDANTGGQTSSVGEPSIANNGREIYVTGNWYASRSLDHGNSWSMVSPYNLLPPVNGGFCCDQVVHYDRSRDLLLWLLQYNEKNGTNTLRLAVKRGDTLGNDAWQWWDFRPETTDATWTQQWFDYPDLELSNNFAYISTNVFRADNERWTRSVIFRIPLDTLAAGGGLDYRFWTTTDNFALRCTRGARDRMYFASHNTNKQLRLFTWRESDAAATFRDVDVSPWAGTNYATQGPDGTNWLARADQRITGAWVADGVIGLAWTAGRKAGRPFPYVRCVLIDERAMTATGDADIWNANHAYAYPDACPNDRGHVGITLFRGGGNIHPSHVVGIRDDYSNGWQLMGTANGTHGPVDTKWGDYLACRRHTPDGTTWLATGYTLQGGGGRDNIQPRVVHFGRRRDERATLRWAAA